jgi:hypothetical protein
MTACSRTSASPPATAARSWHRTAPTIVAEALRPVAEPIAGALGTLPCAPADAVARALVRALAPPEAEDADAPWLWPEQRPSARRVVAAIRRFGGALLADPVGSGKSYVALAVARALNRGRPTAVLAPATLVIQWERLGARLGVPVVVGSHERASRGRLPRAPRGLVIVDESHWLRHPRTRRYRHVARWLLGRQALLMSATPAVNGLRDAAAQLLLAVRDDALAPAGVGSLGAALAGDTAPIAIGRLVLAAPPSDRRRPGRVRRAERAPPPDDVAASLRAIDALALSADAGVAELIRGSFVRALASSPAAFRGALRRYARLLEYAGDAGDAGRTVSRAELRRLVGAGGDQLLLWELCAAADGTTGSGTADLIVADLPRIRELERRIAVRPDERRGDAKSALLAGLLADRRPTAVFVAARDTVGWLRDRLGDPWVAWCTGARAGIGRTPLARGAVLDWFLAADPERDALPGAPRTLVATDVAAEGLDFRRVERVVHYDLPWTAMRLEQREGRALRAGAPHAEVEVVEIRPARVIERRLRQAAAIATKARLPAALDLDARGAQWRWRAELADEWRAGAASEGIACVGGAAGALAGFAIRHPAGEDAAVVWLDARGATESAEMIQRRLREAAIGPALQASEAEIGGWLDRLAPIVRERLRAVTGGRWGYSPGPEARALVARLEPIAREAARRRDAARLATIERALGFAARGHTAGEAAIVAALAAGSGTIEGVARRAAPDADRSVAPPTARLLGMIVFRPTCEVRAARSPACRGTRSAQAKAHDGEGRRRAPGRP